MTDALMEPITAQEQALVSDAVSMFRRGDDDLWDFALSPALELVGQNKKGVTAAIAQGIKRSEDTVEGYAKVGKLWYRMLERFPSVSEILRAELYIGHFVAVARKHYAKAGITLTDAANYLELARKDGLTVEELRDKLPAVGTRSEIWNRSVTSVLKRIEKGIIHAPSMDEDAKVFERVTRISKKYVAMVKKELGQL
jgi:hypothetical protein